jgi:E3 ubiquitin-protein ligase NRDP1
MACSKQLNQHGYDERRFIEPVKRDLFCSICQEVLRDPRTCQNKEHPFCLGCILKHLQISHTCPECREHLTPETLKNPSRILKNDLSQLKIKCDNNERGCPGYVLLENLQHHIDRCGFAPVMCENEGCGTVVNRKEKEIHESNLCLFRVAKCHDREIKAILDENRAEIAEVKRRQEEIKANQDEIKSVQNEMRANQDEMKAKQNEIKSKQDEIKVSRSSLFIFAN